MSAPGDVCQCVVRIGRRVHTRDVRMCAWLVERRTSGPPYIRGSQEQSFVGTTKTRYIHGAVEAT